jgi:outer membrane protein assembly factor BamB
MNVIILILISGMILWDSYAEDWPTWRGLKQDGISNENHWLKEWKQDPNILWEAELGIGFSSFSVHAGKVVTAGFFNNEDVVYCMDAMSGKIKWSFHYPSELDAKYYDGGTSATPVFNENKVYHLSRNGELFCLSEETGKVVWKRALLNDVYTKKPTWGFASSPVVVDGLVILNVGSQGTAINKETGEVVWKSDDKVGGYTTAVIYKDFNKDTKIAVFGVEDRFVAVEVKTGKLIWEVPWKTSYDINAADPVISGNLIYLSSGYGKGCGVFKIHGNGVEKVWENKEMNNHFNSSVLVGGRLYGFHGNSNTAKKNSFRCLDFNTGNVVWNNDDLKFGSLFLAGQMMMLLDDKGELILMDPKADEYKETYRMQLLSGRCWTVPVLVNGLLYARNASGHMVCLDLRIKS